MTKILHSLQRLIYKRLFFLGFFLVFFSLFFSSSLHSSPLVSNLELTLEYAGELIEGRKAVTIRLFNENSDTAIWEKDFSAISFDNGEAIIPIGPLSTDALTLSSPNISLIIDDEEIIIKLDAQFSSIYSRRSEKVRQFYHDKALYIYQTENKQQFIGIGTKTPSEKLDIHGNLKFTLPNTGIMFFDGSKLNSLSDITGSLENIWLKKDTHRYYDSGFVGIGLNHPKADLHVLGNIKFSSLLDTSNHRQSLVVDSTTGELYKKSLPDKSFQAVYLNPLGFFTDSPAASLEVLATPSLSQIFIAKAPSGQGLYVKDNGDLGIGLTTPSAALEVFNSSETDKTLSIKNSSGKGMVLTADGKLGLGLGEALPIADLDLSGNLNVSSAYLLDEKSFFETPVNTTNTVVSYSLDSLNLTSGSYNTFFGYEAGFSQSGADNNTFIGYRSGYSNETGKQNTAFGSKSAEGLSGDDNLSLGHHSGISLGNSNRTVFIGRNSGKNVQDNSDSILVGDSAGESLNGDYNSLIGYQAGQNLTGTGNVFIGYQAGKDLSVDNILFIGNSETPLIYGNFLSKKLAIATSNLRDATLFVDGLIEVEGLKFPDGTIQRTADVIFPGYVWNKNNADIYYTSGNVKIGVNSTPLSPRAAKLFLKSKTTDISLAIEGNQSSNNYGGSIHFGDSDDTYLAESADDELSILAGKELLLSSKQIELISSKNVKLTNIKSSQNAVIGLMLDSNNSVYQRLIPAANWETQWTASNSDISRNTGKIGLGTSTPNAKLSIRSNSSSVDILKIEGNSSKGVLIKNDGSILASGNLSVDGDVSLSALSTSQTAAQLLALNSSKKVFLLQGGSKQPAFQLNGNLISPSLSSNTAVADFVLGHRQMHYLSNMSGVVFDKSQAAFRAGVVVSSAWEHSGSNLNRGTASVAFGHNNAASGAQSSVLGGKDNTASGAFSIVLGGRANTADGDYSLAAGRRAQADHDGSFVWADSEDADFSSTIKNQVIFRAENGMGINTDNTDNFDLNVSGTINADEIFLDDGTAVTSKTFVIDHPTDPDKYLVHATIEGPEAGVYYRGTAQLKNGKAIVTLPAYFEDLVKKSNRSVDLSCAQGWSPLFVEGEIEKGRFLVRTTANGNPSQSFSWIVYAERKDIPKLQVEVLKSKLRVKRFGPYTYGLPQ